METDGNRLLSLWLYLTIFVAAIYSITRDGNSIPVMLKTDKYIEL